MDESDDKVKAEPQSSTNPLRGNTKMCSVLFVDIVGYSKKTNAEQIVMKQQFVSLWAQAMKEVPPDDVMVVDAGDGAALTALVEPEDTIRVALALRNATDENNKHNEPIGIRMGINFGPVQLAKDVQGKACIVGDAINIAQRVMSFADAGQITISRSYYDVIKPLAHKYEEMFYYLGQRADKHVRYHHIYGLGKPGQSAPPIGNAVPEGYRPIKDDDDDAKHVVVPADLAPAAPPPPPRPSFIASVFQSIGNGIKAVVNFIVSIIRSILYSIRSLIRGTFHSVGRIFRWVRLVLIVVIVAYELLVLTPLMGSTEDMKKELSEQFNTVTHYAKAAVGMSEESAHAVMTKLNNNNPDAAATKQPDETHPPKAEGKSKKPQGK